MGILVKLGVRIPTKCTLFHILWGFQKQRNYLKTKSQEQILSSMATDDENALEDAKQIAEFTALIALSAFFEGRPETLLLAILNYVGYCLRKGATDSKAMVMAAIAILHSLFGSFQEGKPYA